MAFLSRNRYALVAVVVATVASANVVGVSGFSFRLQDAQIQTGLSLIGNRRTQEVPLVSLDTSLPAPISQAPLVSASAAVVNASGVATLAPPPAFAGAATSAPAFSPTTTVTATRTLNAKSTGRDVLKHLALTRSLAPYVGSQGVAVVTGGSSGLGRETVEHLAKSGMKVVLCARNTEHARKVVQDIYLKNPGLDLLTKESIRVQALDLADLSSVQKAVEEILKKEGKIDVICNNAGVNSVPTLQRTAQNFEMHLGVNHVGHFYLTRLLLPAVNKGGRVVTVSSTAHGTVKTMPLHDLNLHMDMNMEVGGKRKRRYSPWKAYGQSKLANTMFAAELQDRLDAEGRSDIVSVALHPGIAKTNMWRQHDDALVDSLKDHVASKTACQGAATSVFACLAEAGRSHTLKGGDFLVDCEPKNHHKNKRSAGLLARDTDCSLQRGLWAATENMILDAGFKFKLETF
jgi:NAD(P)-dependent dehydrogenase (short-subunit alcohol dehydrogenase family)